MKSIALPRPHKIYSLCGPDIAAMYANPPATTDQWQEWERSGPRCDNCLKKREESGQDTFCGQPTVIAIIWESPGEGPEGTEPGDSPGLDPGGENGPT